MRHGNPFNGWENFGINGVVIFASIIIDEVS